MVREKNFFQSAKMKRFRNEGQRKFFMIGGGTEGFQVDIKDTDHAIMNGSVTVLVVYLSSGAQERLNCYSK